MNRKSESRKLLYRLIDNPVKSSKRPKGTPQKPKVPKMECFSTPQNRYNEDNELVKTPHGTECNLSPTIFLTPKKRRGQKRFVITNMKRLTFDDEE
ncbi:hypothetical protein RR46_00133 [Papilio xuthus]|uniref:Uncharacterized protein n=1 Tax=Papilio xuthus TaxID=66420 RepID=A0A0N1PFG7_PAPXU|nr:hypothetical protein RR46_00133 [Papilio xuthus]